MGNRTGRMSVWRYSKSTSSPMQEDHHSLPRKERIPKIQGITGGLTTLASPDLWLMPPHRMHMTTLEVTHSRTPEEIAALVATMRPAIPALANYTHAHRARLVRPMVSYDLAALALSFVPAAGEPVLSPPPTPDAGDARDNAAAAAAWRCRRVDGGGAYSYHHLRRDVFDLARTAGVDIASRYVVPSAHITLGRHITQEDHATPEARRRWVEAIDGINRWLEAEVWDREDAEFVGEWVVGQEKGLEVRHGSLWYGAGHSRTVMLGEGF